MNNTTKMLLPVTALCIYCSGCVAYETPVYHRTPTYVSPTTTYVTEPAYIAPATYSTTTYVAEPIYIEGGYRHHSGGHIPPHGKHRAHHSEPKFHAAHGRNPSHSNNVSASHNPQHRASNAPAHGSKSTNKPSTTHTLTVRKTNTTHKRSIPKAGAHSRKK